LLTTGDGNTASGSRALLNNTTGNRNIALGRNAGTNLTTGSDNIAIGNRGVPGESATIRIGDGSHIKAAIAGIHGKTPPGVTQTVVIGQFGELGSVPTPQSFLLDGEGFVTELRAGTGIPDRNVIISTPFDGCTSNLGPGVVRSGSNVECELEGGPRPGFEQFKRLVFAGVAPVSDEQCVARCL